MSRLGLSRRDIDDLTPLELDAALEDHQQYHNTHGRQLTEMLRYSLVILINKGVKDVHQIKNVRKFFPLFWDGEEKQVEIPDWNALDRKYCKNK